MQQVIIKRYHQDRKYLTDHLLIKWHQKSNQSPADLDPKTST
jgi:hypothetical protein